MGQPRNKKGDRNPVRRVIMRIFMDFRWILMRMMWRHALDMLKYSRFMQGALRFL